jgi:putative DNA primase/helicase
VEHKAPSGEVYHSTATQHQVERVLKWVKIRLAIKPELADPPGINCTNGVLELTWVGSTPRWQLVEHEPKVHFYTYEPQVRFDPSADPTHCARLLEVLDKPQQEIFLRIAASLDLATVRQHKGRLVRAILPRARNNGKDSLREVVSRMYGGKGMTAATLSDFAQYDTGRKFP